MKLNPHEIGLPIWDKLKTYQEERLIKLRSRIEVPRITETERLELAWRIFEIKHFLALGDPGRKTETDAG